MITKESFSRNIKVDNIGLPGNTQDNPTHIYIPRDNIYIIPSGVELGCHYIHSHNDGREVTFKKWDNPMWNHNKSRLANAIYTEVGLSGYNDNIRFKKGKMAVKNLYNGYFLIHVLSLYPENDPNIEDLGDSLPSDFNVLSPTDKTNITIKNSIKHSLKEVIKFQSGVNSREFNEIRIPLIGGGINRNRNISIDEFEKIFSFSIIKAVNELCKEKRCSIDELIENFLKCKNINICTFGKKIEIDGHLQKSLDYYVTNIMLFMQSDMSTSLIVVRDENSYRNLQNLCEKMRISYEIRNFFDKKDIEELFNYSVIFNNLISDNTNKYEISSFKKRLMIFNTLYDANHESDIIPSIEYKNLLLYEICTQFPRYIKEINQHVNAERITPDIEYLVTDVTNNSQIVKNADDFRQLMQSPNTEITPCSGSRERYLDR